MFTFQTYVFYFIVMGFRDFATLINLQKAAPAKTKEDQAINVVSFILLPFFVLLGAWGYSEMMTFALNNSFLIGHEIDTNFFRLAFPCVLIATDIFKRK